MESRLFEEVGRGWADTAHTTELQRRSFLRLLRLSAAKPGPARFRYEAAPLALESDGPKAHVRVKRSGPNALTAEVLLGGGLRVALRDQLKVAPVSEVLVPRVGGILESNHHTTSCEPA